MCRTELATSKGKRSLFTGKYVGKSIERGRQGGIAKKVGCARMTCMTYINAPVEAGKVEKLSV